MRNPVNLSIRIPRMLAQEVEARAVKDGMTKSDIIRIALDHYLVEEPYLDSELRRAIADVEAALSRAKRPHRREGVT